MARFRVAYDLTMSYEGVYSLDPADPGGETFCGISRVHWPDWDGWPIVDQVKAAGQLASIGSNQVLRTLARGFYKANFWDAWRGDDIHSQPIANKLFDLRVNLPPRRSPEFLQEALNLANRDQAKWPDIKVDGIIGPATIATLNRAVDGGDETLVLNLIRLLHGEYYLGRFRASPKMEKYVGWIARALA